MRWTLFNRTGNGEAGHRSLLAGSGSYSNLVCHCCCAAAKKSEEQQDLACCEIGFRQNGIPLNTYLRHASFSDIENGKGEDDASTLALLAHILNKPLGYFYPPYLYLEIKQEDLSQLENELLVCFREIVDDSHQEAAIKQV